MPPYERKTVRLGRAGRSRILRLPKAWLRDVAVGDSVVVVRTEGGIRIEAPGQEEPPSIEDEPEFALFLNYLMKSALAHPEELVNAVDLLDDEGLFDGVEVEE